MSSYHTGIALWFTVPIIVDQGRERHAGSPSPVIIRDEVEIFVPTCLRLLLDYPKYLVDRRVPLVQINMVPEEGHSVPTVLIHE